MLLSPADYEAFAAATGTPYPASPSQKAAITPIVLDWKAAQQQQQTQNRGPSATSVLLGTAGAAGLTAAGLALYNSLRRQGLDDATAARTAAEAQAEAAASVARNLTEDDTDTRNRSRPAKYGDPALRPLIRAGNPRSASTAVPQVTKDSGVTVGSSYARGLGQYKARSDSGWHDPAIASLTTPEARSAYLGSVAAEFGTQSDQFNQAAALINAMETTTPTGVEPLSYIDGLSSEQRYGTRTAEEVAATGGSLSQTRTKANTSAQAGYKARGERPQFQVLQRGAGGDLRTLLQAAAAESPSDLGAVLANSTPLPDGTLPDFDVEGSYGGKITGIDPLVPGKEAEVFFLDSDNTYKPYIGTDAIRLKKKVIYTGKKSNGEPVGISDIAFFPRDDVDFYERSGLSHPLLSLERIAENQSNRTLNRAAEKDDQTIKGLQEPLPATQSRVDKRTTDFGYSGDIYLHRNTRGDLLSVEEPVWTVAQVPDERLYVVETGASQPVTLGGRRLSWSEVREPGSGFVRYRPGQEKPSEHVLALDANGQPLLTKRPAAYSDVQQWEENAGPDAPLYKGRVAAEGIDIKGENAGDNLVFGSVSGQQTKKGWKADARVPLDLSGYQSEMGSATIAGQRLRLALEDHAQRTGKAVPKSTTLQWAAALAKEHNTSPDVVLRAASGETQQPTSRTAPLPKTRAYGASAKDALDAVYVGLGMYGQADQWELEKAIRSGDLRTAADSLASQLPGLTGANSRFLRGLSQDEKLNVVAEGVSAGLKDLSVALQKADSPLAGKFGAGKGAGGFFVDAFIKSYVRDWVTVRSLQLDPSGQPTYQVPADAFELIAYDANQNNRTIAEELDKRVSGAPTGLEAALRLDRLVSTAQSTKEADPNTNATRFAQEVFSSPDPDFISTRLVKDGATDVRLSFASRLKVDPLSGYYNQNPAEVDIDQRIEDYGKFNTSNSVLEAQVSGTDRKGPNWDAVKAETQAKQKWITENAEQLERARTNLNRGIVSTRQGPVTAGRGIVISSGERGAYLAGDTVGVNTSYQERTENDLDTTPVDVAQELQRENQLYTDLQSDTATEESADFVQPSRRSDSTPVSRLNAEQLANAYRDTRLNFKNLGPGSYLGDSSIRAMDAGEAFVPRRTLRQELAALQDARAEQQLISRYLDAAGALSMPIDSPSRFRVLSEGGQLERNPAATGSRRMAGQSPLLVEIAQGSWAPADALSSAQLQAVGARPTPPPGPGMDPHGTYGTYGLRSVPRPPADPMAGIEVTPRAAVTPLGSPETAERLQAALDVRASGRGEGFTDDANMRDRLAVATGEVEAKRQANIQMGQEAFARARATAARAKSAYPTISAGSSGASPAVTPSFEMRVPAAALGLDSDGGTDGRSVSGAGRRGSFMPTQALSPITTNTLAPTQGSQGMTGITEEERSAARNQHLANYITKVAAPGYNRAGAQTSGWAGGDSYAGGARQAGRAADTRTYTAPSAALERAMAFAARRRGGF